MVSFFVLLKTNAQVKPIFCFGLGIGLTNIQIVDKVDLMKQ